MADRAAAWQLQRPTDVDEALAWSAAQCGAMFVGGGTELLPLSRLRTLQPGPLVATRDLGLDRIERRGDTLVLGAAVRMADAARSPLVREQAGAVAQALAASASPQVRNVATLAGNLMQRTRCAYFRGTAGPCHRREPGSGCAVLTGEQRLSAIFGTSAHCHAVHASDLAVALLALRATLVLQGMGPARHVPLADFYRLPYGTNDNDTVLAPGELITAIELPCSEAARASHYLKVRDRASFQFAVLSVAVALHVDDDRRVADVGLAAGGVGTVPWPLRACEAVLQGRPAGDAGWQAAGQAAVEGARPLAGAAFKVELLRRCVTHALSLAHTGGAR